MEINEQKKERDLSFVYILSDPLVWSETVMVGVEDAEDCTVDKGKLKRPSYF